MQDWDDYGVEWMGPISVTSDSEVVVEEIEDMLDQEQRLELDRAIGDINPSCSAIEELIISQFSTAKQYVLSCVA